MSQMGMFNGPSYVPERDDDRLKGQIARVFDLMKDGQWRTLPQIAAATGDPEASISAQLRHLRKDRFGAHTVERDYISGGLHKYRLLVNTGDAQQELPVTNTEHCSGCGNMLLKAYGHKCPKCGNAKLEE